MNVSERYEQRLNEEGGRQNVDEDEVTKHKVKASESGVALVPAGEGAGPVARVPVVRSLGSDRASRREAAEQARALQEMAWKAQRTDFATQTTVVVAVHAMKELDACQDALMRNYLGVQRTEAMQGAMGDVTARLWAVARAAVLSYVESYPKRMAEEL